MKFTIISFLILSFSLSAFAAIKPTMSAKERLMQRKAGLTSKITHKRLERAFRYSRNKEDNKAVAELLQLLKQTEKRRYEYALVWQNLGFTLAGSGNNKKAIKALKNALKVNTLPYAPTMSTLYTLAQLQFAEESFEDAHATLTEWFSLAEKRTAQSYMLMGMILGQKGEKAKALDYVNQAINLEAKPQEKWLQYALSLNHSLERFQNALKILITLTSQYPEKGRYWKQLYQTYLSLFEDEKALAIMEMAYKEGHITEESEINNMVSLMIFLKMPYKGAVVLDKEIQAGRVKETKENLELLSQAFYQARELDLAVEVLERAGNLSNDGEILAKRGYMLLEGDKVAEAINSFEKSLVKGKLKDTGKVHYAIGLAHFSNNELDLALASLKKAQKHKKDDSSVANLIDQIKNQKMALSEQNAGL
ncbi:MAG: hypothetical protein CME65_14765 [Halobacteriovoraceae bacterium]|nr:hypothetical protein [Halobacteriovoraceae bacterium]